MLLNIAVRAMMSPMANGEDPNKNVFNNIQCIDTAAAHAGLRRMLFRLHAEQV